jgi:hypothetical protein
VLRRWAGFVVFGSVGAARRNVVALTDPARPRPRVTPFPVPPEAEALRCLRLGRNLRLVDVAKISGIPLGRLSMLERGLRPLTPDLRRRIERVLRSS